MQWLRDNDYRYLVVSRERTRHFDPEAAVCIETASRHGVHLHKVVSDDGQELRLHCFSEERAAKERAIVERFATRFEQALTKLSEGLSRPRTEKTRRQHPRTHRTTQGEKPRHRPALPHRTRHRPHRRARHRRALHLPAGRRLDDDPSGRVLPAQQSDRLGRGNPVAYLRHADRHRGGIPLAEIRTRPAPIFHHKPIRAEGHLFITVIAYQLVQVIRRRLRQTGETASWDTLRQSLEGHQRLTATFRRADGRTLHVRKATRAEPPQQAIYDALSVDPEPGGIQKTIV